MLTGLRRSRWVIFWLWLFFTHGSEWKTGWAMQTREFAPEKGLHPDLSQLSRLALGWRMREIITGAPRCWSRGGYQVKSCETACVLESESDADDTPSSDVIIWWQLCGQLKQLNGKVVAKKLASQHQSGRCWVHETVATSRERQRAGER